MRARRWLVAAGAFAAACQPDPARPDGEDGCAAPGTICTWMGVPGLAGLNTPGGAPQHRTEELLYLVQDLDLAADGTAYVADLNNHRIARVAPDGLVTTIIGHGRPGDGPPLEGGCNQGCVASESDLWHPSDVALAPGDDDVLYAVAWQNHRVLRIDLAADELRWLAGVGEPAYGVDPVALSFPSSVVADVDGALYVADQANQLVRRLDPDGAMVDVAGTPGTWGYAGDGGPARDALLHGHLSWEGGPTSKLALDGRTLYLADTVNGVVRTIDLDAGTIERFAGVYLANEAGDGSVEGYAGDGGPALDAQLWRPRDIEVGPDGTVYVADTGNHCVRAVGVDGIVRTVVGQCGQAGYGGDGGAPEDALLDTPCGVAVDRGGDLYVADSNNHLIRRVTLAPR